MKLLRITSGVVVLAATFGLVSSALAELNLTPRLESTQLDGIILTRLSFESGSLPRASYQPPQGWKSSGGENRLELEPIGVTQARVRITKHPALPDAGFGSETINQLTSEITTSLPEGAEGVTIEFQGAGPLQISKRNTVLIEVSYTFYGQRFSSYSLFLKGETEGLCFQLTSRSRDYEKLRHAFQQSLYTWQL